MTEISNTTATNAPSNNHESVPESHIPNARKEEVGDMEIEFNPKEEKKNKKKKKKPRTTNLGLDGSYWNLSAITSPSRSKPRRPSFFLTKVKADVRNKAQKQDEEKKENENENQQQQQQQQQPLKQEEYATAVDSVAPKPSGEPEKKEEEKKKKKKRVKVENVGLDGNYWNISGIATSTGVIQARRSSVIASEMLESNGNYNSSRRKEKKRKPPKHQEMHIQSAKQQEEKQQETKNEKKSDDEQPLVQIQGTSLGLDGEYWKIEGKTRQHSAPIDPYLIASKDDEQRRLQRPPRIIQHSEIKKKDAPSLLELLERRAKSQALQLEKSKTQKEAREKMKRDVLQRIQREMIGAEVIPGLFLGSYKCSKNLNWLRENGVHYIVNCTHEVRNSFGNITPTSSLNNENSCSQFSDEIDENSRPNSGGNDYDNDNSNTIGCEEFEYKRFAIRDSENYGEVYSNLLGDAISHVETRLNRKDGKILIHCKEGKSRAPTLVISYLISKLGWSLTKAYGHVSNIRNGLRLNPAFENIVSKLELKVSGVSSMDFLKSRRSPSVPQSQQQSVSPLLPTQSSSVPQSETPMEAQY